MVDARLFGFHSREVAPVFIPFEHDIVVRAHGDAGATLRAQIVSDNWIDVKPVRIDMGSHDTSLYGTVLP